MKSKRSRPYKVFWGDTHHNSYTEGKQDPALADILAFARTYLDFYAAAYYTPEAYQIAPRQTGHTAAKCLSPPCTWLGVRAERTKTTEILRREWIEVQEATAGANSPGRFVTFPGFEWQGAGCCGDHNVIYKSEGPPVYAVPSLTALYDRLRGHEALAIPHHTGYCPGIRAPRWEHCDEKLSPFTEIFSAHGCSETDEELIGLRANSHMGPGVGGSTYQEALDAGLHLGAICSTDNWTNLPGCWGQGLMACMATELTRKGLWDAFVKRRVYGISGDRIELDFTCNGAPMGSILNCRGKREIRVVVKGQDALDRIEILRNGRLIATHCHQDTWRPPRDREVARFMLRIEPGWGPRIGDLPFGAREWSGEMSLAPGRFIGWSPCWIARGQKVPKLRGSTARFSLISEQHRVASHFQGGIVLEFEAAPSAEVRLRINGQEFRGRVADLAQGSRVLWYRADCLRMIEELTGAKERDFARRDPLFYQYAFKVKLHRAIPQSGYRASFSITDTDRLAGETNYRVRVEQRNGQRAWSSPIWVRPE